MKVNLNDGMFYCFGCNKSGDAIDFVNYIEKDLNDLHATMKYFKILKSDKAQEIKTNKAFLNKKAAVKNSNAINIAHDYYYGLRKVDWSKVTKQSEDEVKEVYKYMKARGFTGKMLIDAGAKVTYNNSYQIIMPMLDNGEFKGWVCRTTKVEVEKKRKYLYNEGFSRSDTLVGNYNKNIVIIVEGYMDRLKLMQFGALNAVAILGWKITSNQVLKLKDAGIKKVVSMLDSDKCGRQGTEYLKSFFDVIEFRYENGIKDPGMMNEVSYRRMKKDTQNHM